MLCLTGFGAVAKACQVCRLHPAIQKPLQRLTLRWRGCTFRGTQSTKRRMHTWCGWSFAKDKWEQNYTLRPIWSLEVALLKNLLLDLVDCERGAANLSLLWLSCSASPAISSHLLGLRQWRPWRQIERFNKELNAKFKFASKVLERLQSVNKMREEPKHKNRCVWIYTYNHIYLCVWL